MEVIDVARQIARSRSGAADVELEPALVHVRPELESHQRDVVAEHLLGRDICTRPPRPQFPARSSLSWTCPCLSWSSHRSDSAPAPYTRVDLRQRSPCRHVSSFSFKHNLADFDSQRFG